MRRDIDTHSTVSVESTELEESTEYSAREHECHCTECAEFYDVTVNDNGVSRHYCS